MSNGAMAERMQAILSGFHEIAPGTVGDRLNFQFVDCDPDGKWFTFSCTTEDWMVNPHGTLHGGIGATVVDQAMGTVVTAIVPDGCLVATSEMQVSYHRPLFPEKKLLITVRVLSKSSSLVHLTGQANLADDPDRLCISSTSVYFYRANKG